MSVAGMLLSLAVLITVGLAWTIVATYKAATQRNLRVSAVVSTFLAWLIIVELAYVGVADPVLHPTLYGWIWLVLVGGATTFMPLIMGLIEKMAERKGLDMAWSLVVGASIGGALGVMLFLVILPMLSGWIYWVTITIPAPLPSPF